MLGDIFSFDGRLGRLGYLWRVIKLATIFFIILALLLLLFGSTPLLSLIYSPTIFIIVWGSQMGIIVRRLHDINLSGWISFLWPSLSILNIQMPDNIIVNIFALICWVFLILWPGTKGDNKYGDGPIVRTPPKKRKDLESKNKAEESAPKAKVFFVQLEQAIDIDEMNVFKFIKDENSDILKINLPSSRDSVKIQVAPESTKNSRQIKKILEGYGIIVANVAQE